MRERGFYIAWFLFMILACSLVGISFDLVISTVSGGWTVPWLAPFVGLSALCFALTVAWRRYGEARGRFNELEADYQRSLDSLGQAVGSRQAEITRLIQRIEEGRGWERQAARNEARAWLALHAHELTKEERAFAAEHLGYLHRW